MQSQVKKEYDHKGGVLNFFVFVFKTEKQHKKIHQRDADIEKIKAITHLNSHYLPPKTFYKRIVSPILSLFKGLLKVCWRGYKKIKKNRVLARFLTIFQCLNARFAFFDAVLFFNFSYVVRVGIKCGFYLHIPLYIDLPEAHGCPFFIKAVEHYARGVKSVLDVKIFALFANIFV